MIELLAEGRYDRQELITWWDQAALRSASVLVVGAGALGNEVVKNLALLGVGHLTVVDMDTVSTSNLSRCVLFREGDEGQPKALLVADRARDLNPDVDVDAVVANVQSQGVGWIGEFDVVLGCLDNREARLWVNQACRKFHRTWIDGAIEGIRGVVKVFPPSGACYECTLGEVDRAILAQRKACSLLTSADVELGKVPTTATSSAVVAGLQSQEAVRLLNGGDSPLANRGWFLIGESFDTYVVDYPEDEWCPAHEDYEGLQRSRATRGQSLAEVIAPFRVGTEEYELGFEDLIVRGGRCVECNLGVEIGAIVASLSPTDVECPRCRKALGLDAVQVLSSGDELLDRSLADLGLARFDVVTLRTPAGSQHIGFDLG